ncbi:MAG: hypothetical protein K2X28_00550 [Alphaproteobacteria bacterium]|nr:hypothetical protein [Alphaproteobacteria bacterium]
MKLTQFTLSLILMLGNISTVLASSSVKLEEVRGHHHQDDRGGRDDSDKTEHEEKEGIKMPGLGR